MRLTLVPFVLSLSFSAYAVADDILQQAEALIAQHKATEAVQLLEPLEDERAGDPAYDYVLGAAYLDANQPTLAVFAFERCLAAEPKNGPCRVQIARTHLVMGETANARTELDIIQSYNPPPAVQTLVDQYLGAIASQAARAKRQINAFVQIGMGTDTNINSATDQKQIALPAFNNVLFTVAPNSQKQHGTLLNGIASGTYLYQLTPAFTAIAEGSAQVHNYQNHDDYSYQTIDVSGGGAFQQGMHQLMAKLQLQKMWLSGNSYRDVAGLLGQYQYRLMNSGQFALYSQFSQIRFDEQASRDANRITAGLAYSQALATTYSPVFYGSLYNGQERTKDSAFDAYSQDFYGLRIGGALSVNEKLKLNAALSSEKRKFKAVYAPFAVARDDNEYALTVGASWRLSADTSLQPNYTFTKNNSNIPLTDYDRHVVSLDLRFDL